MGNIQTIETAYERTKEYIVYDSFQTIMIAIVLFLVFMQLFDEYHKNISNNNGSVDLGAYFGQIKVFVMVGFIATSAGVVFNLVESVFADLQTNLINDFGGDSSEKSLQAMRDLVKNQIIEVQQKNAAGVSFDVAQVSIDFVWECLSAVLMSVGVFIFKYTYTFFILGRYMWLLMLELVAPVAIVLIMHENTRTYFYSWLKNMLICYMLIPMFLLADKFSNEVAGFCMEGTAGLGQATVFLVVCIGVWVKIKMFSIVRSKSTQLF